MHIVYYWKIRKFGNGTPPPPCFMNVLAAQLCLNWSRAWMVRIHLQCRRLGYDPWVRKIPWRSKWQPSPTFLPGKSMHRGAWQATPWGCKESVITEWPTVSFSPRLHFVKQFHSYTFHASLLSVFSVIARGTSGSFSHKFQAHHFYFHPNHVEFGPFQNQERCYHCSKS